MGEVNYAELYATAIEAGGGNSIVVPDGPYAVRVGSVKKGSAKSGAKPQVGIRLVVAGGAYDGQSVWVNQTFTADNPAAVAIFLRIMSQLGVPQDAIIAGLSPLELADYIVIGTEGVAELGHHVWNSADHQDLKKFTITGSAPAPQVSVGPSAVPQVVAAPVAAPVVQAPPLPVQPQAATPVVVAAPAVVATPVAGNPPF